MAVREEFLNLSADDEQARVWHDRLAALEVTSLHNAAVVVAAEEGYTDEIEDDEDEFAPFPTNCIRFPEKAVREAGITLLTCTFCLLTTCTNTHVPCCPRAVVRLLSIEGLREHDLAAWDDERAPPGPVRAPTLLASAFKLVYCDYSASIYAARRAHRLREEQSQLGHGKRGQCSTWYACSCDHVHLTAFFSPVSSHVMLHSIHRQRARPPPVLEAQESWRCVCASAPRQFVAQAGNGARTTSSSSASQWEGLRAKPSSSHDSPALPCSQVP